MNAPENSRQLSFRELKSEKGIRYSRMTVWRMMRDGQFPQSYRTPTGRVFWWAHEVDAHKASLMRGKGTPPSEQKQGA